MHFMLKPLAAPAYRPQMLEFLSRYGRDKRFPLVWVPIEASSCCA